MEVDNKIKSAFSRGYMFGLLRPEKLRELSDVMNGSSAYCIAFKEGIQAGLKVAKDRGENNDKGRGNNKGMDFER